MTPKLVRNAARYADLTPSPVEADSIRLAHSGGAVPGRNIEEMIGAVLQAKDSLPLKLYLVPANDGGDYLKKLHSLAGNSDRITFHKAVEPHELLAVLNQYDVGTYWIPPTAPTRSSSQQDLRLHSGEARDRGRPPRQKWHASFESSTWASHPRTFRERRSSQL